MFYSRTESRCQLRQAWQKPVSCSITEHKGVVNSETAEAWKFCAGAERGHVHPADARSRARNHERAAGTQGRADFRSAGERRGERPAGLLEGDRGLP